MTNSALRWWHLFNSQPHMWQWCMDNGSEICEQNILVGRLRKWLTHKAHNDVNWKKEEAINHVGVQCSTLRDSLCDSKKMTFLPVRVEDGSVEGVILIPSNPPPVPQGEKDVGSLDWDVVAGAGTVSWVKLLAARERAVSSCFGSMWEGGLMGWWREMLEEAGLCCFFSFSKLHR